jgi:hypothetical protein
MMRGITRLAPLCAFVVGLFALTAVATADPGEGHGDGIEVPTPGQPNFGAGMENMKLLDTADKDGTINSDIAFHGNKAYVGNYDGFRIFNIKKPTKMDLLSDTKCRANQGDLSVFKSRDGRMILLQSIDRPVTAPDCTGVDTGTTTEDENGVEQSRARFGFEGLRMFDVSNPRNPKFLRMYRTECGSHTHTLVPDKKNGEMHVYVPSYPLLSQITPQIDHAQSEPLGLTCDPPHSKISIVSLPLADPEAGTVHKQPLASDTEFYDNDGPFHPGEDGHPPHGTQEPFQACHDFQVFEPRNIVVGSCAGDLQYWDISDRGDPTSEDGEPHTLIQREVLQDDPATPENERWESFDFVHNATVTWDGQVVAAVDESGGGVQPRCDGSDTKRGFTFFYPLVEPGTPVDGFDDLLGRYVIPRPQSAEECVSHNGTVLPTDDGSYLQVQAFYKGGSSLFDFSDPAAPEELAFADLETSIGNSDSWSTYWYNDVLYTNGGLDRGGPPPPEAQAQRNRGFEAFAVFDENGDRIKTRDWKRSNPQTQESFQVP